MTSLRWILVLAVLGIITPWCVAADAPPAQSDPHQHLQQILQRPMYQAWQLRQAGNLPDIDLPEIGWGEWLKQSLRAVGDFFDWLFRSRSRGRGWSMPSGGSVLPAALRLIAWGVVAVAAIFIILLVIRAVSNSKAGAMSAHILSRQQIHESLQSGDALALGASEWLEEADRLADEKNFRAVYRALYLALLSGLHTLGKIEHSRHRTNGAYLRQYRGPDAERAVFKDLTDLFERVWYGRKGADDRNLDELRQSVAALTASGRPA